MSRLPVIEDDELRHRWEQEQGQSLANIAQGRKRPNRAQRAMRWLRDNSINVIDAVIAFAAIAAAVGLYFALSGRSG